MKTIAAIALIALLSSGCASADTWKDVAESDSRMAGRIEYGFLNSAWNAYLAAHSDEPEADLEYRRKAARQHLMLQCGHCAAVRAYLMFKKESESDPTWSQIFSDVTRIADLMEEDFVKTFDKNTQLKSYPRVPNKPDARDGL